MVNLKLPLIDSCNNCGACCREQHSPPGYAMLLSSPGMMDNAELFAEDVERIKSLPKEAIDELRTYLQRLLAGEEPEDPTCIWLDRITNRCRFPEHRPMICRDFERGSDECRVWRRAYRIE